DEVHRIARVLQKEQGATYLCFQNQLELNFFLLGHPETRAIRVLAWCIAEALYLKGFLLSQRERFTEALACLEELIGLAPLMARAHGERGFVLTRLGRHKEALAAFSQAWDLATRLPTNSREAGPALRGMAVVLVEVGELDRAEKLLHDSLE